MAVSTESSLIGLRSVCLVAIVLSGCSEQGSTDQSNSRDLPKVVTETVVAPKSLRAPEKHAVAELNRDQKEVTIFMLRWLLRQRDWPPVFSTIPCERPPVLLAVGTTKQWLDPPREVIGRLGRAGFNVEPRSRIEDENRHGEKFETLVNTYFVGHFKSIDSSTMQVSYSWSNAQTQDEWDCLGSRSGTVIFEESHGHWYISEKLTNEYLKSLGSRRTFKLKPEDEFFSSPATTE